MTKKQLRDYCEAEFENIEVIVSQLFTVVKPEKKEYSISELAAIATFTHNFYNGCENILKRVLSLLNLVKIRKDYFQKGGSYDYCSSFSPAGISS